MDYCLLEDAFKTDVNCKDGYSFDKQQKHEKKKHKKTKDCFNPEPSDSDKFGTKLLNQSGISDRPALNAKQYSEAFENTNVNIPNIKKTLIDAKLPSHFLGVEDDPIEGFIGDFDKAKVEMGFEKVSGESNKLPLPSLDDNWKPLTPASNNSAYFKSLPTPGGTFPIWNKLNYQPREFNEKANTNDINSSNDSDLVNKINVLIQRLDALEKEYSTPHLNNQQEILAFVGTGVFMIFTLSLLRC